MQLPFANNSPKPINKLFIKGFITTNSDKTFKNGLNFTESGINFKKSTTGTPFLYVKKDP